MWVLIFMKTVQNLLFTFVFSVHCAGIDQPDQNNNLTNNERAKKINKSFHGAITVAAYVAFMFSFGTHRTQGTAKNCSTNISLHKSSVCLSYIVLG